MDDNKGVTPPAKYPELPEELAIKPEAPSPTEARERLAKAKAAVAGRVTDLNKDSASNEELKKKSRKKLVIGRVGSAAAAALAVFGITAAGNASRIAAYDAAVEGYNVAVTSTISANADIVTPLADFEKASKTYTDGFVAQVKVAATAPKELISENTNKPVVELNKQLEDAAKAATGEVNTDEAKKAVGEKASKPSKPAAALATSEDVDVTAELIDEVEAQRADAETRLLALQADLKTAIQQSTDLDKAVLAGAETISARAVEALKNKDAFAKTAPKADAKDFNTKADALKKSVDAYTKAENPSVEQAAALVKTESDFVAAATALKAAHEKKVADEAAQAAAEAAAAANAYVEPQWDGGYAEPDYGYVPPADNGWDGGGGSNWTPPPANNGGGGGGGDNSGGGGGGGTPQFNPGDFTEDPCVAAGNCIKPNI